jgi:preprotein translocase subunit SecF
MRQWFKDISVNWLGMTKYFVIGSLVMFLLGVAAMVRKGGPLLGIDFKGGTLVYVRFQQAPNIDRIREGLRSQGLADASIQQIRDINNPGAHEVVIGIEQKGRAEEALDQGRNAILAALRNVYGSESSFEVRNVEVVGPKVGAQLQQQAILATVYALAGMLVYIAFRFEWIYGAAAVIAVFHDVLITVGFMTIFNYEISLTVIAALLTLVGYSMNDTIVIFDRMRENLRLMRRESLERIANVSINQTLSRTFLTSGLTFLTVLVLYLMGGEVLRAFSFALVVGVVIGSYSTVGIAAAIVVAWDKWKSGRRPGVPVNSSAEKGSRSEKQPEREFAAAARR